MRISELSARSGVSVATLKFYLREGLLPRGEATSATQATYEERHLERVRLIHALSSVAGLPLARVGAVLAVIDGPDDDLVRAMGRAINELPPQAPEEGDLSRADAAVAALGLTAHPEAAALGQLDAAIRALEAVGLPVDGEVLERYGRAALAIARDEVAPIESGEAADPVAYAVLGTIMYEPLLLALRRLAHLHLLLGPPGPAGAPGPANAQTGV